MAEEIKEQLQSRYALILLDTAILFEYTNNTWQVYPIYDEKSNSLRNDNAAANIVKELDAHINTTSQLRNVELIVIYNKEARSQIPELSASLLKLQSVNWQLLAWQFLIQKLNNLDIETQEDTIQFNIDYLSQSVLPIIDNLVYGCFESHTISQENQTSENDAIIEHTKLEETIESNHELQQKVQRLQHQANALQGISMHKITAFMPAIYQNFWHVVKPSDIGLLVGSYDIPEIPSPFPEPTMDTIYIMKKQFLALPKQDQLQIIEFCQQLTYPLNIRQEFKAILA